MKLNPMETSWYSFFYLPKSYLSVCLILSKESFVWLQQDAYVLCRVFHKNNIGPPSGNRYAPFLEEEWADEGVALIPGVDVRVRAEPLPFANGNNQMDQVCASFIYAKDMC